MNTLVHLLLLFVIAHFIDTNPDFETYVVSAIFIICMRVIVGRKPLPNFK